MFPNFDSGAIHTDEIVLEKLWNIFFGKLQTHKMSHSGKTKFHRFCIKTACLSIFLLPTLQPILTNFSLCYSYLRHTFSPLAISPHCPLTYHAPSWVTIRVHFANCFFVFGLSFFTSKAHSKASWWGLYWILVALKTLCQVLFHNQGVRRGVSFTSFHISSLSQIQAKLIYVRVDGTPKYTRNVFCRFAERSVLAVTPWKIIKNVFVDTFTSHGIRFSKILHKCQLQLL